MAFVAGWVLVATRTARSAGAAWHASTWIRRDSGQYLKIASYGYRLSTHCKRAPAAIGQVVHLCGNITWFPGYPAVIRLISLTGLPRPTAAVVVAWACWYLTLVMVWMLTLDASVDRRWGCVLLAAVFPGQVYFAAAFPLSLCTFAMLATVYAVTVTPRRGFGTAAGFVAGATYLPALALAPSLLIGAFLGGDSRVSRSSKLAAAAVVAGFGAVLGYAQLSVGRWDAYFVSEKQEYGVHAQAPWRTFIAHIAPLWTGAATPAPGATPRAHPYRHGILDTAGVITARQTVLVTVLLVIAVGSSWHVGLSGKSDRRLVTSDVPLACTAAGAWLIPYLGGGSLSIYRSEACLIVLVPLLRRCRWWQLGLAAAAAGWIAYDMAPLFETNILV